MIIINICLKSVEKDFQCISIKEIAPRRGCLEFGHLTRLNNSYNSDTYASYCTVNLIKLLSLYKS